MSEWSWFGIILIATSSVLVGYYWGRKSHENSKICDELSKKLNQSEQDLTQYKQEVNEHFERTAALINNMTQSYQDVHEHLVQSSHKLSTREIAVNSLDSKAALTQQTDSSEAISKPSADEMPIEELAGSTAK